VSLSSNPLSSPTRALSAAPPPVEPDESPVHVLVVDDEDTLRRSLGRMLQSRGLRVGLVEDASLALDYIAKHPPDVALVDMMMPGMSGVELLGKVKEAHPEVEVIMMTAFADVASAVNAMQAGAYHFLTKPFHSNDAVVHAVLKAAEHRRLLDRAKQLEERLLSKERFGEIIGTSSKMQAVYRLIEGVATATSTVLILGESGTGKELVARAIHQRSPRANKPFVAVNCAAIPKELVESELFGHVRGAFTGAQSARAGLFETASGGTIFLDEVGDLPLAAQVKLLRTLQEGEVKRVGSDDTRIIDVRVVAATNVDLIHKIETGAFRKDLFYRLNVIAISLPPLRERADDIVLLAQHFVHKFSARMQRPVKRFSAEAVRALREYGWPGNVRELEHAIERAVVLAPSDVIGPSDLPFARPGEPWGTPSSPPPSPSWRPTPPPRVPADVGGAPIAELAGMPYAEAKKRMMAFFDEAYTNEILRRTGGNMSEAARQAGLDRSNFRRIVRRNKR
jgi:DNA-binding NtrC family response regulator